MVQFELVIYVSKDLSSTEIDVFPTNGSVQALFAVLNILTTASFLSSERSQLSFTVTFLKTNTSQII